MSQMPTAPTKRGKPPEQYAEELAAFWIEKRAYNAAINVAKREKLQSLGVKQYVWCGFDVFDKCHIAKQNDQKTFSFDSPPPEGHPGEGGECSAPQDCFCFANPVIKFG